MSKITRGWPPERRAAQAENIRKTKPWLKTTGPRTDAGKNIVRDNALKHGYRSMDYKALLALLRAQESLRTAIEAALRRQNFFD